MVQVVALQLLSTHLAVALAAVQRATGELAAALNHGYWNKNSCKN
jgi:hypothetical protein